MESVLAAGERTLILAEGFSGDAHYGNFSLMLRDCGLPASQGAMGAFVASAALRT